MPGPPASGPQAGSDLVQPGLVERLAAIVGAAHVLVDAEVVRSYTTDWTGRFSGPATLVVRPSTTEEVAAVLQACAASHLPVVVQGGNTGLVGGSVPPPADGVARPAPVVLSTVRLAAIGPVDRVSNQVTAGAGATLAGVQAAAHAAGLSFPVDLAARDTATVGGMVATNAGGLHVIRYGAMRSQVLGMEVVLADGQVLSRMSGLVKDNTGYDLSQLMVGSEGTLGVVTAVRLRLVPHQPQRAVALLGVDSTAAAVALASELRRQADGLSAVEIFYQDGLDLVCHHCGLEPPFSAERPVYLLVEAVGRDDVIDQLASVLADTGIDDEATAVADDESGAARLWAYRERHTEAISGIGVPHKLDVTLPIAALADFERAVRLAVAGVSSDAVVVLFGHVGDGNLHVNVVGPPPDDERVDAAVLELVASLGGSISAEHGIGRAKVRWLGLSRSPAELATMRAVKDALDPEWLLNPGVLLDPQVDGGSASGDE
ncbi:MAG: FAD-binding oxidoreductase [Actinomycetota bacterium]|nr:FAD-binding oxidoreductase [Actinomycetota bacterium]